MADVLYFSFFKERLAQAIDDTLFFAGEALSLEGHIGTVYGAIGTGKKAAERLMVAHHHTESARPKTKR